MSCCSVAALIIDIDSGCSVHDQRLHGCFYVSGVPEEKEADVRKAYPDANFKAPWFAAQVVACMLPRFRSS